MNMEKTTERYPIRYYSIITVAKDFIHRRTVLLPKARQTGKR